MQTFCAFFGIQKGVTALIGGGGKTSAMYALAEYLCTRGSVIVCTSTHILCPPQYPYLAHIDAPPAFGQIVSTGVKEGHKLTSPAQSFDALAALADYVLVEADGSRQLPLKAHAPHEPVIPEQAKTVLAVIGIDGLGKPIREVAHRPERFAAICGVGTDALVTPEMIRTVMMTYPRFDGIVINKADNETLVERALALAERFPCPVAVTAWQTEHPIKAYRRNEP